jgi:hypothetical protein
MQVRGKSGKDRYEYMLTKLKELSQSTKGNSALTEDQEKILNEIKEWIATNNKYFYKNKRLSIMIKYILDKLI